MSITHIYQCCVCRRTHKITDCCAHKTYYLVLYGVMFRCCCFFFLNWTSYLNLKAQSTMFSIITIYILLSFFFYSSFGSRQYFHKIMKCSTEFSCALKAHKWCEWANALTVFDEYVVFHSMAVGQTCTRASTSIKMAVQKNVSDMQKKKQISVFAYINITNEWNVGRGKSVRRHSNWKETPSQPCWKAGALEHNTRNITERERESEMKNYIQRTTHTKHMKWNPYQRAVMLTYHLK